MKKIKEFLKKFYILRLIAKVVRFPINYYKARDHVRNNPKGTTKLDKTPYIIRRDG